MARALRSHILFGASVPPKPTRGVTKPSCDFRKNHVARGTSMSSPGVERAVPFGAPPQLRRLAVIDPDLGELMYHLATGCATWRPAAPLGDCCAAWRPAAPLGDPLRRLATCCAAWRPAARPIALQGHARGSAAGARGAELPPENFVIAPEQADYVAKPDCGRWHRKPRLKASETRNRRGNDFPAFPALRVAHGGIDLAYHRVGGAALGAR
jgi:hypothetical protein